MAVIDDQATISNKDLMRLQDVSDQQFTGLRDERAALGRYLRDAVSATG